MSARHKLPADPTRAARGDTDARDSLDPDESPQENEFYAAWESRDYGQPKRHGRKRVATPQPQPPANRQRGPARPAYPTLRLSTTPPPSVQRRTIRLGSPEAPLLQQPSAAADRARDSVAPAATPATDSGLFVRQPSDTSSGDVPAPNAPGGRRWHADPSPPPATDPIATQLSTNGSQLEDSGTHLQAQTPREETLQARLQEALRNVAESESGRIQAERRARSAEQRVLRTELGVARPTLLIRDTPEGRSQRWQTQRVLWIGLGVSVLCLFLAAAYSEFYVPTQRSLVALQSLHRRTQEQNDREITTLRSLLEQERTRAAIERDQLTARLRELLERRAREAISSERDTPLRSASAALPSAADAASTSVQGRSRLRRQLHSTRSSRDASAKAAQSSRSTPDEPHDDSVGNLQLR